LGHLFVDPQPNQRAPYQATDQETDPATAKPQPPKGFAFVCPEKRPLTDTSKELLNKIIRAMNLNSSEVIICDEKSYVERKWTLLLGNSQDFAQLMKPNAVFIAHPEDMLAKPELKKDVWLKLQQIMKQEGL